jgi:hypothetical protein
MACLECPMSKIEALIPDAYWNTDKVAHELTSHRVNGLNESLRVFRLDQPGQGGACHQYVVCIPCTPHNETYRQCAMAAYEGVTKGTRQFNVEEEPDGVQVFRLADGHSILGFDVANDVAFIDGHKGQGVHGLFITQYIGFQDGPVKEFGYNGNSHEALLAILLDRMEGFQKGEYACHDNQMALDHLQGARLWLHKRTMDRVARQVEGTHLK